jgi:hypothetical protein
MIQLGKITDWGNPSQFKPCPVSRLLNQSRDLANPIQWTHTRFLRTRYQHRSET